MKLILSLLMLAFILTGCVTKEPVKSRGLPNKPFKEYSPAYQLNYACPYSGMDEFHRNMHSQTKQIFPDEDTIR